MPQLELGEPLEDLVRLLLGHELTVRAYLAGVGAARQVTGDCQAGTPMGDVMRVEVATTTKTTTRPTSTRPTCRRRTTQNRPNQPESPRSQSTIAPANSSGASTGSMCPVSGIST